MDLMDFIKMGFFFMAYLMAIYIILFIVAVAQEGSASTSLQNFLGLNIYLWSALLLAMIFGFIIYIVWWIPHQLMKKSKNERRQEGR
jgi:phage shock protein PspC (stress-responsive transcriptional regulator)